METKLFEAEALVCSGIYDASFVYLVNHELLSCWKLLKSGQGL